MKNLFIMGALLLSTLSVHADTEDVRELRDLGNDKVSLSSVTIKIPIVNFSQVNEGIYRGARLTTTESLNFLKSLKVKNIINLQGGDLKNTFHVIINLAERGERASVIATEKQNAQSLDMGYLHSPLDSLDPITPEEDKSIDETLSFMSDKNNWPLFIHCEHGADRTGLLVALYRVKYEGMDVEAARKEWIQNGHNKLHQLFTGVLDDYYYAKVKEFSL